MREFFEGEGGYDKPVTPIPRSLLKVTLYSKVNPRHVYKTTTCPTLFVHEGILMYVL